MRRNIKSLGHFTRYSPSVSQKEPRSSGSVRHSFFIQHNCNSLVLCFLHMARTEKRKCPPECGIIPCCHVTSFYGKVTTLSKCMLSHYQHQWHFLMGHFKQVRWEKQFCSGRADASYRTIVLCSWCNFTNSNLLVSSESHVIASPFSTTATA